MSSSIRLSVVCLLSTVTFMLPTETTEIFGNVSMPYGTLTIHDDLLVKNFTEIVPGEPLC